MTTDGLGDDHLGSGEGPRGADVPVRVFISYAHDNVVHEERVRNFWLFLHSLGIDAKIDLLAAEQRVDWAKWTMREIRDADHVLVIASPEYRRRAEGDTPPDHGRGVQWEARQIQEIFYADQESELQRVVPVVLPECSSADIPLWLAPQSSTHYVVTDFTVAGAERLLRLLTGQPWERLPPHGEIPILPPRGAEKPAAKAPIGMALQAEVMIEASISTPGTLESAVWIDGTRLSRRQAPLPAEVTTVWKAALGSPGQDAKRHLANAGRALAAALLDQAEQASLAGVLKRLRPGDAAAVVLIASGQALALPIELILLAGDDDAEFGPLGLLPAVSVSRRVAARGHVPGVMQGLSAVSAPTGVAGPLKILAAVAAPDKTKWPDMPLDVEAEMQAVLDAVVGVTAEVSAQVRVLEVASLSAIRQALADDAYHVLHLSAHGSSDVVELEDEDGRPVEVSPESLMQALQHAGRPVPLIVLSSCSGESSGPQAMAAGLIDRGADRVIAMLAPVTRPYAVALARYFYRELSAQPSLTVGHALARARYLAEEDRSTSAEGRLRAPEYGLMALLASGGDGSLVNMSVPPMPLKVRTLSPGGRGVRELPVGVLIGRRTELRTAMAILRRTPDAVRRFGVASGVQLTGIGGIGKTAVAGRVISRLRADGWLIAVHEGRWNPSALIAAVADAIADILTTTAGPESETPQRPISNSSRMVMLREALTRLTSPDDDNGARLAVINQLLANEQLLLAFDDFEQNLTGDGSAFLDATTEQAITAFADAAEVGVLLLTSRYTLPGPDRFLVEVPVSPLTAMELRRLFLRLPALADLDGRDRRLLARVIGGHPRLIEFADALMRGGRASLRHVQVRLRNVARDEGVALAANRSLDDAVDQALLLGSADIMLTELLGLLTPRQTEVLAQITVGRAPMSLDDLAFALRQNPYFEITDDEPYADLLILAADVERLASLTLLIRGEDIVMHPWVAGLVIRHMTIDLKSQHERALAMRYRRFEQHRAGYDDLLDIPQHLKALRRYDDIAGVVKQAIRALPSTRAIAAYLSDIRPLIPRDERAWIVVADLEVEALLRAGKLSAAIRSLQAIHQHVQKRANTEPDTKEWQRDLSISHNKLGDAAASVGDVAAARIAYQASMHIRLHLLATDPGNSQWQRDLSVSYDKLGDVDLASMDLTAARAAYQASQDIRVRLASDDPGNTQWQRDLSVSYDKLGDVDLASMDLTAARAAYQASQDIRVRLASDDPGNTQWQRDLSVSYDKLGDVDLASMDLTAARAAYQASQDIRVRLASDDPGNTQWQRDLSVSYDKLGDVDLASMDLTAARAAYQASQDIRVRLASDDPGNTQWQRDLSVSYDKLGDVDLASMDLTAARAAYQASQDIRVRLASDDPGNTQWQRDLSVSYDKLGDVDLAAGELTAARAAYQASQDIRVRLASDDPGNTQWQRDLSVSYDKLGDVDLAAGELTAARAAYQASQDIRVRLASDDPGNTQWQRDLQIARERMSHFPDAPL